LFPSLQEASFLRSENKKSPALSRQGFFFVAEGGLFYDTVRLTAQVKIPASAFVDLRGYFKKQILLI
jgi:hypothetical protein